MRHALLIAIVLTIVALTSNVIAADRAEFREFGKTQYQVLESNALTIYAQSVIVRKGAAERAYFFSVGPNGDVQPLTVANLKKAFPENHRFHDLLDLSFKHDSELNKYDQFHGMFKVNRLLAASEER